MNKKILFQIFLLTLLSLSIIFFYYVYFYSKKESVTSVKNTNKIQKLKTKSNLIKDIEYSSVDEKGNRYWITSEYGEIDLENSNLITMENVLANIDLIGRETITISSDYANYDNKNFNTIFRKNVILEYLDNKIVSDNMDLSVQEKFVQAYNNVVYTNLTNKLFADKIEMDLITKNSKILMNDGKKVKIIGK